MLSDHLAKNIVLAGVKSVTVYDPEPVRIQDLSTQVCRVRTLSGCRVLNISAVLFERRGRRKGSRGGCCSTPGRAERLCTREEPWRLVWTVCHCRAGQELPGKTGCDML